MSSFFRIGERIVDGRGGMLPSFQLQMQQLWDRAGGFGPTPIAAPTISAPIAAAGPGGSVTVVNSISAPAAQAKSGQAIYASPVCGQNTVIFAE